MPMLIDCHTHLDHCRVKDTVLVEQAREAGVGLIIQSGVDLKSSRYSVEAAERFPEVMASVGFHPHDARLINDRDWEGIKELATHPRVVAVGETGFDFYRDKSPRDLQEEGFLRHIELAREMDLPLVIHTREATECSLDVLGREADGLTVILHCFSIPEQLDLVVERGYFTSFAGNVTYKSAADLREAAGVAPIERLLLETDAPYLTPVPLRGKPNQPALVAKVYDFVAAVRDISVEELAEQVRLNVMRAYPKTRALLETEATPASGAAAAAAGPGSPTSSGATAGERAGGA